MVIMRLMKIQIFIQFLILVSLLTLSPKHGNHEVDENPNFFQFLILVSLLTLSPKHGNHEADENPNFHSIFDPSIFANTITKTW